MTTITKAATQIGVSGQTIKNWQKKYPGSFSIAAKRKYDKHFDDEDIQALKELQQLKRNGLSAKQIKEQLPLRPQEMDPDPEYPEQEYQEPPLIEGEQDSSVLIINKLLAGKDEVIGQLTNERDYLREQLEDERRSHWRIRKPGK